MDWFESILELLEKIPSSFWGIVIGSSVTLGTVIITNRASSKRMREQFAHDHEVRVKDREMALRKEVYLAAVEAISAGFLAIGKFGDLNIPDTKITEEYQTKASAIGKVQIIATEETAKAVTMVAADLTAVFLKLFGKRIPLNVQKGQVAILDGQIASFEREQNQALELMKKYNLAGSTDQRLLSTIQENFKFEQNRIAETTQRKLNIIRAMTAGQLDLAKESFDEVLRLNLLALPAIFAVRRELELPIDEAAYTQMVRDRNETQKAHMDEFLTRVRSGVEAHTSVPST